MNYVAVAGGLLLAPMLWCLFVRGGFEEELQRYQLLLDGYRTLLEWERRQSDGTQD